MQLLLWRKGYLLLLGKGRDQIKFGDVH